MELHRQPPDFDDYEKLIDYYHTLEHLSLAAQALFGEGAHDATAWYDKYRKKLLEEDGGARSVLRSMDYYSNTRALPKSRVEALAAQQQFCDCNNLNVMLCLYHMLPIAHLFMQLLERSNLIESIGLLTVLAKLLLKSIRNMSIPEEIFRADAPKIQIRFAKHPS